MKISINEGYFRKIYGSNEKTDYTHSIKVCKDAGFDAIDFSLSGRTPDLNIILRNAYLDEAKKVKEYCDNVGISVNQTHARYDYNNLGHDEFVSQMIKTVKVSKTLGADCTVVHADTYYDPEYNFDFNKVLKIIYDVYAPIVEEAEKQGIKIAMETLFEDRAPTGQRARFTSYVDELNAIVFAYNTPSVGICWDFGHARVSYGAKQFEEMKKVGNKIISTHVHDNRQKKDLHLIPFLGDTDWELGLKTLKEVGYTGDLTFELGYGSFPEELITDYINLVHKIGKFMVDKFNNF